MSHEKVVSIYSRVKPRPVWLPTLEAAAAAASIMRKQGFKVRVMQEEEEVFTLLVAA